ncbi:Hypothetical predicted protein [Podarcis lilfordi]|uniref:Uncharacterized protein n=1 Tax=Podarcis lilfordi TaxID=74358 RepID=A0AA35KH78_9SAUR|nr:Hypothetical predicted protein [Podarcis lilfordi]
MNGMKMQILISLAVHLLRIMNDESYQTKLIIIDQIFNIKYIFAYLSAAEKRSNLEAVCNPCTSVSFQYGRERRTLSNLIRDISLVLPLLCHWSCSSASFFLPCRNNIISPALAGLVSGRGDTGGPFPNGLGFPMLLLQHKTKQLIYCDVNTRDALNCSCTPKHFHTGVP